MAVKKYFIVGIFYLLIIGNYFLNANPFTLAKNIANTTHTLTYYYWVDPDDKNYYLAKKNKDKTYSVWLYTENRKWKPIHNTKAFDGFDKANKYFSEITFNGGSMYATKTCEDCNNDNSDNDITPPLPFEVQSNISSKLAKAIKVSHYFWIDKFGIAYLMKPLDDSSHSVWHYTKDRKWEPIHNAKEFDGFMKMENIFKEISFRIANDNTSISIGDYNNYLKDDFELELYSNDANKHRQLTNQFLEISPSFSWRYHNDYKKLKKKFILQIQRKDDNSLIYSTMIDGDKNTLEQGKGKSDMSILPRATYCEQSYIGENIKNEDIISYKISLYAIFDDSIIPSIPSCAKEISKEGNHFAKDEIDVALLSKVSVKANIGEFVSISGGVSQNIEFTFLDNTINGLTEIKDNISIYGLAKGINVSYKRKSDNVIIATLDGASEDKSDRGDKVEFKFSSSLFSQIIKQPQYAYIIINFHPPSTLPD